MNKVAGLMAVVVAMVLTVFGLSEARAWSANASSVNAQISNNVISTGGKGVFAKPSTQSYVNGFSAASQVSSVSVDPVVQSAEVTRLSNVLMNPNSLGYNRLEAAQSLGQIGDSSAVWALSNALKNDAIWYVSEAAAQSLGQIGDSSAVGALSDALKNSPHRAIFEAAAEALGKIGGSSAVEALSDALDNGGINSDPIEIVNALVAIGDSNAVEALSDTLIKNSNSDIRVFAADALGKIADNSGDDVSVKIDNSLRTALDDEHNSDVRQHIWMALD